METKKILAFLLVFCLSVSTMGVNAQLVSLKGNEANNLLSEATPGEATPGEATPGEATPSEATESITLQKTLALKVGQTVTLKANVIPANSKLEWKTSNSKIATVVDGKVKAVANGTAYISVKTVDNKIATCKVTVTTDVTKVTVKTSVTLAKGSSTRLIATVAPATASNKKVTYTTSDKRIATVDSKGTVRGIKKGVARITVKSVNGKTAVCKVTVAEAKFNVSSATVQVGKSTTAVKVVKYPTNDTVKAYKSLNTKIATVDSRGKITGKKVGKTTIIATMKSGAKAVVKITVQKGKVVTKSITLNVKSLTLKKGKSATLKVTRNPITATEKVTWTTSNKKVATVINGKVIARGYGVATITARTSNGKKVTCKVIVPKVTLKATKATIKVGKTTTISVKSKIPSNDKVARFKSSNTKVATVNLKGTVKGIKKGSANIVVTMKSGATATFRVTVR